MRCRINERQLRFIKVKNKSFNSKILYAGCIVWKIAYVDEMFFAMIPVNDTCLTITLVNEMYQWILFLNTIFYSRGLFENLFQKLPLHRIFYYFMSVTNTSHKNQSIINSFKNIKYETFLIIFFQFIIIIICNLIIW